MQDMGERMELSARRGSSPLARLASIPLALIPWLMTLAGMAVHAQGRVELGKRHRENLETTFSEVDWPIEWTLGATAVLVLAALFWALLTAWSSLGTVLAGLVTIGMGVAMGASGSLVWVLERASEFDWGLRLLPAMLRPEYLTLFGSLLLAVGVAAAAVRRLRR